MKIYIVYEGEFCTDKPREYMAIPDIHLVTEDLEKAKAKAREMFKEYKERDRFENLSSVDCGFSFNDAYNTYGRVGIIEKDLE